MYTCYYNPEIFLQAFDGIDRSNHIVATYLMDDALLEVSSHTVSRSCHPTDESWPIPVLPGALGLA